MKEMIKIQWKYPQMVLSCIPCDQDSEYAKYSNRFINQITSTSEIAAISRIIRMKYVNQNIIIYLGRTPKHH